MAGRLDLPPNARRLNVRLAEGVHASGLDDETIAVLDEMRSLVVNAVTELENDQIIGCSLTR
ncbi:hypothetical protein AB4Z55_17370 [Gordonia sp. ABKF26]|uniref:hypothetical protein n=1 Tax=Gordonia sp. ABKF26 TaxID=3238687 RepID=UPI0034E3ADB4